MVEIPIEIWAIIILAFLGYFLLIIKIWRNSNRKANVTYVVNVTPKEAQKLLKAEKKRTPKKKPKPSKPSPTPESPLRLDSCREGQFFGFLHDLPKNTPVPDNCLDCPKLIDCMRKRK